MCENATSAFYRSGQFITVVFLVSKLHLQHHFFYQTAAAKMCQPYLLGSAEEQPSAFAQFHLNIKFSFMLP